MTLVVKNGAMAFVYSDELAEAVSGLGPTTVRRASHVEPASDYGGRPDRWAADMKPSGGPVLLGANGEGFTTRALALLAEREWLAQTYGL